MRTARDVACEIWRRVTPVDLRFNAFNVEELVQRAIDDALAAGGNEPVGWLVRTPRGYEAFSFKEPDFAFETKCPVYLTSPTAAKREALEDGVAALMLLIGSTSTNRPDSPEADLSFVAGIEAACCRLRRLAADLAGDGGEEEE